MLPGINQIRVSMFGVLFMIKSFSPCSIEGQVAGKRFSCVKNAFNCPPFQQRALSLRFLKTFYMDGGKSYPVSVSSLGTSFFAWFRIESSAKREWLVTKRLPLRANFHRERERRLGPCGAQVEIELKMAGNKNKNVNWGLTSLFPAFQQNHHNHQLELVVMPNEMVALITVITHWTTRRHGHHFCPVCPKN